MSPPLPGPSLAVHDGLLAPKLFDRLSEAMAWVPMYFHRAVGTEGTARGAAGSCFYPLATVEDKRSADAEPLLDALDASLAPVRQAWRVVRRAAGAVRLYECECTANPFGSEGHPHHDCLAPRLRERHVTAIVHCNREWQPAWAGETVIFDEREDIASAVIPRPGRIVMLRGDPLHAARGVSLACPVPRRVLVFKMWQVPSRGRKE